MNEQRIVLEKEVPVVGDYDVVVCGGGPAGWVAAVSAARGGCRTALIERYGFLGGTATAGLVAPISGCYHNGERVVGSIPWEFVKRLEQCHGAQVELPKGHVSFDPELYKLVAQRMVREEKIDRYMNSYLSGCGSRDGRISHVYIENKNGTEAIAGRCFIDGTGDGDLCAMAGIPMLEQTDGCQPLSLCFVLSNVDVTTDLLKDSIHHDGKNGKHSCNMIIHEYLEELGRSREIPYFGGPWFNTLVNGDGLAVNITRLAAPVTDNRAYMEAESKLREDMFSLVELLRQRFKEFKHCVITASALQAGVRESRHIRGVHTLTGEEMRQGIVFRDTVARCAHPIDIHSDSSGDQILRELECAGYIPYRTMVAKEAANLIAAGRCISAEREPYASLRVQATAMAIGEAAGVAAALHCRTGVNVAEISGEKVRDILKNRGACV